MLNYVMVGSNDLMKSKGFYDVSLGALGYGPGVVADNGREVFYMSQSGSFGVAQPIDGKPACHANGGTIGFTAPDSSAVDEWHAAGIANGGAACEDPPGIRDDGSHKVYCGYLRDPDGNKLCAIFWMS